MATKEQIAANRKNAKKSTGPKSPEGKGVSRLNGLKHGLRSEEVVLPTEDPREFREFLDAWLADWNPPTMARAQLVEEAAAAAWRKRRCLRVETARLTKRVEDARAAWDRDREDAVERLVEELIDEDNEWPRGTLDALMASREGVDREVELWEHVAEAVVAGWNDFDDHHLLIRLHGRCAGDDEIREVRDASLRLYFVDAPEDHEPGADPEPWGPAEAEAVRRLIAGLARDRIAALGRHRESLPDESAARDAFAEMSAFAPRHEDATLLRYEAQLSRQFHRSLADLVKLARSGDDLVEPDAEAPTEAKSSEVNSEERVKTEKSEASPAFAGPERAVGGSMPAREAVARPIGAAGALAGAAGSASCAA